MPPPAGARRGDISLSMSREYKKVKPKGKLSEIIDFHMTGRNRYMVINQSRVSSRQNLNSSALSNSRNPAKFRNPLLNKYEDDGDEDYERKHYVFEDQDDDENANGANGGGKGKTGKRKKRLAKTLKNKDNNGLDGTNADKENSNNDDNNKIDETAKMIEDMLKDKNGAENGEGGGDEDADRKRKHDASVGVSEEEKKQFFKEKNIQVNLSTTDVDDAAKIAKKPKKKGLKNEMTNTDKELKSISTQTPRDLYLELENDKLSRARNPDEYINQLIDDVQKISHDVSRDRRGIRSQSADPSKYKDRRGSVWNRESSMIDDPFGSRRDSLASNMDGRRRKGRPTNSLGLTMEGKNGVNMAIIKDVIHESDLENEDGIDGIPAEKREAVLLRKNYQNLEDLIQHLMAQPDADTDPNYLKIAKLNRLKVLMEMAMKMVGRKYNDIGNEERGNLELEANRYHSTYPLPGEEVPLEEVDEKGVKRVRMPIKVASDDGAAKIDVNAKYLIDPAEFLKIYTSKLINHAQDSTGLVFDNITVTIPTAYGAQQREAIKNSVNQGIDRDDAKILTRPVAAAVILNNQRIANGEQDFVNGEMYKLVFDITEASLDASVIKITDSKDFQVISNVGDASFGVHDIDERIVEHIITEKAQRNLTSRGSESARDVATVNAYSQLTKSIKSHVAEEGVVNVDLVNMTYLSEKQGKGKSSRRSQDELTIDKVKIARSLCKDIYDWSLAHIDKAIHQADVNERDVDEIIIIGGPEKMPGFYECLRNAYPHKRITFVPEQDLAVGAAIVGRKLKYQQIKVTEVLCRSIGIGLYTGVITYLLFRNSSLPCVGGCVYSTLVDDQETMVLDVYEGERPHVKFCRYLGEVTILGLPKGEAGRVKCELYLRMNHEGLLEVSAKELNTGLKLETVIDANPDQFEANDDPTGLNETELSPIEAERYKKPDYDLVYELESLDAYLEQLGESYRSHKMAKYMLDKIFDTKEWLYKNRRKLTAAECKSIRRAIDKYLKNLKSIKY